MITSGAIAAKIIGDTEESGPRTSTRDGPMMAYAREAGNRRVQTGHGWKAGELCICHSLRNQDRGQHDAGDDVVTQPSGLVAAQRSNTGRGAPDLRQSGDGSGVVHVALELSTGFGLSCSTPARVVLSYPVVGDPDDQRMLRGMETIRWLRNGFPPCRQNNSPRSSP